MSSKRWLARYGMILRRSLRFTPCISRVVDRRFVFGDTEREKFRVLMRMQENFAGCRVRERFGPKRKDGARPLRGLAEEFPDQRLFNLRQLRKGAYG